MLAVVGLEVTTEGIRTGTSTERWRERVPNFSGCNAKTASAKSSRTSSWHACILHM